MATRNDGCDYAAALPRWRVYFAKNGKTIKFSTISYMFEHIGNFEINIKIEANERVYWPDQTHCPNILRETETYVWIAAFAYAICMKMQQQSQSRCD